MGQTMKVLPALNHRSRSLVVRMAERRGGHMHAHPKPLLRSLLLLLSAHVAAWSAEQGIDIVVAAGPHVRHDTTVSFPLPPGSAQGLWRLTGEGRSSSAA